MKRAAGLLALLALAAAAPLPVTHSARPAALAAALQSEPMPKILNVRRSGKNLLVSGEDFQPGAVIFINGERQKTRNDEDAPTLLLVAKKAAKRLPPDAIVTIQVENSAAAKSDPFAFFTGLTLTIEDAGKTFHLKPSEQFLLQVKTDDRFNLNVTITDESAINKVADIGVIPGAQVIYEAKHAAQTGVSVVLDPKCGRLRPPCAQPTLTYEFNLIIE